MRPLRLALLGLLATSLPALVAGDSFAHEKLKGKTYYFGTSEPRTNVSFTSDAEIELIQGTTNKMDSRNSKITVDASGKKASGKLRIGVRTLRTGIALRDEHLRNNTWLDAKKHPWITLDLTEATEDKNGRAWTYKGKLTIKGITRDITGKARVRPIPATVKGLGAGEWIRIRARFDVDITKHGINIPSQVGAKVNKIWQVGVDIYGTTAAPKPVKRK